MLRTKSIKKIMMVLLFIILTVPQIYSQTISIKYPIVDTGQKKFYGSSTEISKPNSDESFYGQDAHFDGNQPSYKDNGDGTITDLVTGLMWQKSLPNDKYNYQECVNYVDTCSIAGYTDWRLPTIKELYSLILFSGVTGMSESSSIPYFDTDYFDFRFGGAVNSSERFIDAQYATSTIYKGTTMGGNETMFGVNFVDGRIKGYPTFKDFEIKLVRGSTDYGQNEFVDNGDGMISDKATGLMWDKSGSSDGMNWDDALSQVKQKNADNYLGHNDWRLPNAKELHSIVDYERSPTFTNSAAISPLFEIPVIADEGGNDNYPFYWTSTTHVDGLGPDKAAYVCFGEALGFMERPPSSGNYQLEDVHGAGAQRSDPKSGDPNDFPFGRGPQGDVIRIYNYVRLVRDAEVETDVGAKIDNQQSVPSEYTLEQNYPNPFNPETTISISIPKSKKVSLKIYNLVGGLVENIVDEILPVGYHQYSWNAKNQPSGVFFYTLEAGNFRETKKMILVE
jgi:hypothetical protein